MSLTQRRQDILSAVIQSYSKTNHPVASRDLALNYKFSYSSATIRAEMMHLEKKGLLMKPHVSAGRIPTSQGYRYYIRKLMKEKDLRQQEKEKIRKKLSQIKHHPGFAKDLADMLADLSRNLALVGIEEDHLYFSGLTELVSELNDNMFQGVARFLEEAERNFDQFFVVTKDEPSIFIGQDHPFLKRLRCGLVLTHFLANDQRSFVGLLGPDRMDYEHNLSLLNYVSELLD